MRKSVVELEKDLLIKPMTDQMGRVTTADEMVRVFEEVNEFEHVYMHVESQADFQHQLDDAFNKLGLKPHRRVQVKKHVHPSIKVSF